MACTTQRSYSNIGAKEFHIILFADEDIFYGKDG
jgi:hypothetical protein